MRELAAIAVSGDRQACVAHSTRDDHDLFPSTVEARELERRRVRAVDAGMWHWARQVHGAEVITVRANDVSALDDGSRPVPEADALVTAQIGQVLTVHTADCVPVGFVSPAGAVGVAHAGWKGLEQGVLEATVAAMRDLVGDTVLFASVGPHIRASNYEFDSPELIRLVERFGPHARARTAAGTPALDLTAIVAKELDRLGVDQMGSSTDCTARDADLYWSHRARQDKGRLALVAWLEPTSSAP